MQTHCGLVYAIMYARQDRDGSLSVGADSLPSASRLILNKD